MMSTEQAKIASPPFRGERVDRGVAAGRVRWASSERSGIPHLTPALSAPEGGEGVSRAPVLL